MKKSVAFQKNICFDEFILAIKYLMKNKGIGHVSGLCDAELLRKEMTEEALSKIFFSAIKHNVFVKQKEDVHINHDWYRVLYAYAQAEKVVSIHKPSYEGKKLISLTKVEDNWIAFVQNAAKNEVSVMVDSSLDKLYQIVEPELKKKDLNAKFQPKKINKQLEKLGVGVSFQEKYEYQLVLLGMHNATGQQVEEPVLYHVGKTDFDMLTGAVEAKQIEKHPVEALDEKVKACLKEMLREEEPKEPGEKEAKEAKKQKVVDEEPYTRFSFQKLASNKNFPHNVPQFLKMQVKNTFQQLLNWKSWIIMVLIQVIFAAVVLLWNMYGLCYLNDTFRLSSSAFWKDATAYLFAGTIGRNNDIKGLTIFKQAFDTALLAGSFYFLLGMSFRNMLGTILRGKLLDRLYELTHFREHISSCCQKGQRSLVQNIWIGVLIAAPIGLILWNPFTVGLLALMLIFSCMKADNSGISVPVMLFRSASRYKKVMEGKKEKPLFADVQLLLLGLGIGFSIYSVVNVLLWVLFDYHFWARVVFTVLLMVLALFGLGIIKINKPQKVVTGLVLLVACTAMVVLTQEGMVLLADDGGWSESGGTLAGLINNTGFATILGLSALLAVCTLGGSLVVGGIAAGVVGLGSFIWSSTTETGRATAADFMLGEYSPYGGDSKIAMGLNFAVGLVPGIGEIWGITSAVRDANYNFANGNELSGIFNLVCGGLSLKGLDDGLKLAGEGLTNAAAKKILTGELKETILNSMDNVAQGAAGSVDNVVQAAGGSADNVVQAAAGSADNVVQGATGVADNVVQAATGSADNVAQGATGVADNVAQAVTGSADNVAQGAAGSADNVVQAATGSADNVAQAATGSADNVAQAATQAGNHTWLEKFAAGQLSKKVVNTLMSGNTNRIHNQMIENVKSGIVSTLKQQFGSDVIGQVDSALNDLATSVPVENPIVVDSVVNPTNISVEPQGASDVVGGSIQVEVNTEPVSVPQEVVEQVPDATTGAEVTEPMPDAGAEATEPTSDAAATGAEATEPTPDATAEGTEAVETEVLTSEELFEVIEHFSDEELKQVLDIIAEQFEMQGAELPSLCAELKQYVDSVAQGALDRNVIKYILQKGLN